MSKSINTAAIIRTAVLEDAQAILQIQKEVIAERDYLMSVPEEFNQTLDQQKNWIKKILDNERETILVAEIDNEIVGWIAFLSNSRKRLSHVGSFGIMIRKDYRERGIGRMLISELLSWAAHNPFIEKVSLGVFSTNTRAIALYKSMGFIEEGRKKKEVKVSETEYWDDILMYKLV
ncbi:ribosomal protein S18 acetylase RimI-like enzyme [Bacillus oleivorans]|uniref:Ribosomal protein S18 acetylase RimI-like enzyme n=1 Tax=Bacillus oleivorans TaxID=1448271 RepID=A0A285D6P0_9BACI|nr:GNAT family N-acetyltransferase [Bacillus oleivorans]SNX74823.1 ribosomal protein S18 acetylase RimI-like enzyme [Bacillus oleivorans]